MKQTITAAELMVIVDCLNQSFRVLNYEGFTTETREQLRNKILRIMDDMEADVVHRDVEPQCNETGDGV